MYSKNFFSNQFGFHSTYSAEHAIPQLASQIHESFENSLYTVGVFIDLSKAFDTVNYSIIYINIWHTGKIPLTV